MGKPTFDLVASFYPLSEQTVFGSTVEAGAQFFYFASYGSARITGRWRPSIIIRESSSFMPTF
jgi:hypothetical protein